MFFKDDSKTREGLDKISTFIGADTSVEGTLITKSSVRIDGKVIGGVVSDATVILSKDGRIEGNVIARNIVIAGQINGNLQITDRTAIESEGRLFGDVSTGKILIDEDSIFTGKCTTKDRLNEEIKKSRDTEDKQNEDNQIDKKQNEDNKI